MAKQEEIEPEKVDRVAGLEEQVADLQLQLEAAHTDRINAENEREEAFAKLEAFGVSANRNTEAKNGIQKPNDLHEYKGQYAHVETGEVFGLKVLETHEVRAHKTHHLKSHTSFWDGTAEQFRATFDKI